MNPRYTLVRRPGLAGGHWAALSPQSPVWRTGSLSELLTPSDTVIVLAPSPDVRLLEAAVPGMSRRQARQAIPFSLEDGFVEDLEALHVSIGNQIAKGRYQVAAVAKRRLAGWLRAIDTTGARVAAVVPELLALPWAEGRLCMAQDGERVHIRWGACRGITVTRPLLVPTIVAILDEYTPHAVDVYGPPRSLTAAPLDELVEELEVTLHGTGEVDFGAVVAHMALQLPSMDLRAGGTRTQVALMRALTPWRWFLVTAAVAAALGFGQLWLDIAAFQTERDRWDGLAQQAYQQAFPADGRAKDVARLMRRRLAVAGGSQGASATSIIDLLHIVAKAQGGGGMGDDAARAHPTIEELRYRDGALDVVLSGDELATLEAWRAHVAAAHGAVRAETLSAVATPEGARATVQVRGR